MYFRLRRVCTAHESVMAFDAYSASCYEGSGGSRDYTITRTVVCRFRLQLLCGVGFFLQIYGHLVHISIMGPIVNRDRVCSRYHNWAKRKAQLTGWLDVTYTSVYVKRTYPLEIGV